MPGKERRQRQVAHRVQARRGVEHLRDRIDDDRRGRDVAVDAAGDLHRQRAASLRSRRRRTTRARRGTPPCAGGSPARPSGSRRRPGRCRRRSPDRRRETRSRSSPVASFGWMSSVMRSSVQPERVGDHRDRFGQADVADAAVVHFASGTARSSGRRRSSAGTAAAGCARPARG